ncbi:hypothetical protein ACLKA7_008956 [Drosophila subpalustris]
MRNRNSSDVDISDGSWEFESKWKSKSESSWLVMDAKLVDRLAGSTAMAQEQRCHRAEAPMEQRKLQGNVIEAILVLRLFLCAHGEQT